MAIDNFTILIKRRYSRHYAKADRENHPVTLLCRSAVNNVAASEFSLKERLLPQHWDQKNQRVIDTAPHAQEINERLDRLRRKARHIWDKYEFENLIPTAQQLADELQGKKSNSDQAETFPRSARPRRAKSTILLSHLVQMHIDNKESTVLTPESKTDNGVTRSTMEVYGRYQKNINRYLAETGTINLRADQLDGEWMADFEKWLLSIYDAYYAVKHLYFVKTVLDYGVLKKNVLYNPVKAYPIVRRVSNEELVFLYDEEIERFAQVDFSANPGIAVLAPTLERVRDTFLAMMELGQHYRDYCDFVANPCRLLAGSAWGAFLPKKAAENEGPGHCADFRKAGGSRRKIRWDGQSTHVESGRI